MSRFAAVAAVSAACMGYVYATPDQTFPDRIDLITFGSCNHQDLTSKAIWDAVASQPSDIFVWLGDVVYNDNRLAGQYPLKFTSSPLAEMERRFNLVKYDPPYAKMLDQIAERAKAQGAASRPAVVGVWDDHDYGINDGDGSYEGKVESQQVFLDFLDTPTDSFRRSREGLYASYEFGPSGQQVLLVTLDIRYFQDEAAGVLLGEAQWAWLEAVLANSQAQVTIIGNGIQFLPTDRPVIECWARFPAERARMLRLLRETGVNRNGRRAIVLSGDVHFGETLCLDNSEAEGADEEPLVEVTSSGISHAWGDRTAFAPDTELDRLRAESPYDPRPTLLPAWACLCMRLFAHFTPARYACDSWPAVGDGKAGAMGLMEPVHSERFFAGRNFGSVAVHWDEGAVSARVHDKNGDVVLQQRLCFTEACQRSENEERRRPSCPRPHAHYDSHVRRLAAPWIAAMFLTLPAIALLATFCAFRRLLRGCRSDQGKQKTQ